LVFIRLKFIIMVHNLILNLRTYGTASLSHELFLIIAFGELLIKKVHVRFILKAHSILCYHQIAF
jgi:hypothetical protein